MGIRLIARRLNEEGLKTRRGGNWSMVSIRDILRNRVYLGTYSRFGVKVPGSHPPLVSADDFRVVQDRLSARRTSHSPRVTSQFLLSGIAHCGYCGNKLIGVSRKQSWKRRDGEQRVELVPLLPVRVAHEPERLRLPHPPGGRTSRRTCGTPSSPSCRATTARALATATGAAAIAEHQRDAERLRTRLRSIDRRLEGYVDAAAKGRLAKDKMHGRSAFERPRTALLSRTRSRRQSDAAGEPQDASEARESRESGGDVASSSEWDALAFADRFIGPARTRSPASPSVTSACRSRCAPDRMAAKSITIARDAGAAISAIEAVRRERERLASNACRCRTARDCASCGAGATHGINVYPSKGGGASSSSTSPTRSTRTRSRRCWMSRPSVAEGAQGARRARSSRCSATLRAGSGATRAARATTSARSSSRRWRRRATTGACCETLGVQDSKNLSDAPRSGARGRDPRRVSERGHRHHAEAVQRAVGEHGQRQPPARVGARARDRERGREGARGRSRRSRTSSATSR